MERTDTKMLMRFLLVCLTAAAAVTTGFAGELYEVTSTDGKKTVKYQVSFGGGKDFRRLTAFDPQNKKFVYLDLARGAQPKLAGQIWDYRTGKTIDLYKFPDAVNPLPVVPSIEDLKICPITGDRKLKIRKAGIFD